jgi:transcription initiation factor TFIID subunit 2
MTDTTDLSTGKASREFAVQYQKIHLDIDFGRRAISGKTELLVLPESKDLKIIRLNCRQTSIKSVSIEGKPVNLRDIKYTDPYECARHYASLTANQHHQLRSRIGPYLEQPPEEELHIPIPRGVRLTDSAPASFTIKLFKTELDTPAPIQIPVADGSDQAATFLPLKIEIAFETSDFRDGLSFVGFQDGDTRYPHLYTNNSPFAGTTCSLFPCVDDSTSRHPWDISIRCPRTLGDAFSQPMGKTFELTRMQEGMPNVTTDGPLRADDMGFSETDKALDLSVICSGNLTDEVSVLRAL